MSQQNATAGLIRVAESEYPILRVRHIPPMLPILGVAGGPLNRLNFIQSIASTVANARIANPIADVTQNSNRINEVGRDYGIPPEVIGSIIFQEQVTRRQPDWASNLNTASGGRILRPIMNRTYHSTGLGAIFPNIAARPAWEFMNRYTDSYMNLPETDRELQLKLTHNDNFNIETIAVVLIHKAYEEGYINHPREISNLTPKQWRRVIAIYNAGSEGYDAGLEYSRRVHRYMPYIRTILGN